VSAQPASARWKTIDTPHFASISRRPLRCGLTARPRPWRDPRARHGLHRLPAFEAHRRSDRDPAAVANGIAYPFLDRPVIVLLTSPPEAESDIGEYGDWMELRDARDGAHRPPDAPAQPAGALRATPPAPDRSGALQLSALARGRVRDVVEGRSPARAAAATGRWWCVRLAVEGSSVLRRASSKSGWLGGSMAYLVGRPIGMARGARGEGPLQKLWKRMASRRAEISGRPSSDLRRSPSDPLRPVPGGGHGERDRRGEAARGGRPSEGERWAAPRWGHRLAASQPGWLADPARRDPGRGESYLAVWMTEETEEERKAGERRQKRKNF
jgi:hypothetical protein